MKQKSNIWSGSHILPKSAYFLHDEKINQTFIDKLKGIGKPNNGIPVICTEQNRGNHRCKIPSLAAFSIPALYSSRDFRSLFRSLQQTRKNKIDIKFKELALKNGVAHVRQMFF